MMRMTVKMAAFSGIPLLLLLCSVISSTESQTKCDKYAARGEAFAVPLGHQLKDTERVKWWRGSVLIVDRKTLSNSKFVTGSKDNIFPNGSLTLRNVTTADKGEYRPEVYTGEGESAATLKSVHLCVHDRAPQPTVNTTCLQKSKVKLTCDVGKVKDLTFVWLKNGKEQKKQTGHVWMLELKDVGEDSFSCKVSNPLGTKTSQTVTGLCHSSFFLDNMWVIWACVGGGGGLVLLLTIIVIVCCVRAKRKKRYQTKDEEELRLRWADPQQQHQCPQHGHPASRRHQHQHQHQGQHQGHHQGQGQGQGQGQHQGQHQGQRQGQHQGQDQHLKPQQQQQPAGHTGPRQHRSKQQRPKAPEPPTNPPQPSPLRPAQTTRADNRDEEQAPPLPKPRSKTPRTRV